MNRSPQNCLRFTRGPIDDKGGSETGAVNSQVKIPNALCALPVLPNGMGLQGGQGNVKLSTAQGAMHILCETDGMCT